MSAPAIRKTSSGDRPRVLYLSCHLPWPAISGGRRRELELINRLAARFDVHLLVVSKTAAQDLSNARVLRRCCSQVEVFAASSLSPDAPGFERPPQVRRHRCPVATARANEILAGERVDLIHVEGFYLMQHVPAGAPAPVLLVEQNIEYELERQRAERTSDPDARAQFSSTRAEERRCWSRAARLAAVTPEDRATMQATVAHTRVRVVPDGADHIPNLHVIGFERDVEHPGAPLLVLLANYAYPPNVDAARHLCLDILPVVRQRVPDARVWLVGNAPGPEVLDLRSEAVTVTGRVADVVPYLDVADAIVCPLRIGGGVKVKAIEALRRGKAVVSSTIGAQGLPESARRALVIADDPTTFAEAAAALLLDPALRSEHERRAAHAASQLPTWDDAAQALGEIYDELLHRVPAWVPEFVPRALAGGSR
ncbi:MAG: glycosyltransferase [Solirubrobacterales bacterium]|nr:glycosyltransferase [Solirubrobacterales bacterium]